MITIGWYKQQEIKKDEYGYYANGDWYESLDMVLWFIDYLLRNGSESCKNG